MYSAGGALMAIHRCTIEEAPALAMTLSGCEAVSIPE